ncbi:MAG: tyrosine-type recombinase/integrase [Myxococcota bacterium]|nr:tyrosine-type recombinase/integrase [Myxococcota bacterium]
MRLPKESNPISPKAGKANPIGADSVPDVPIEDINQSDFAIPNQITKPDAARMIANILRRARVDYEGSKAIIKKAREIVDLRPTVKPKRQPALLTTEELHRFIKVVDKGNNLQHQLMARLLFYSGIRVSELTNIRRVDVDIDKTAIRIVQGKGKKDRTTLFPESLKLALSAYIGTYPGQCLLVRDGPL